MIWMDGMMKLRNIYKLAFKVLKYILVSSFYFKYIIKLYLDKVNI